MNEEPKTPAVEEELSYWARHRFLLLIILTIVVALVLTTISLVMYNVSGTAQLDLSRPGYKSVSDKVESNRSTVEYAAFGPVNKTTVEEFIKIYEEQAKKAKAVDAFNGDPLNPEVLMFGTTTEQ
jgi:ABC-type Na+ efflux pump permease subunit